MKVLTFLDAEAISIKETCLTLMGHPTDVMNLQNSQCKKILIIRVRTWHLLGINVAYPALRSRVDRVSGGRLIRQRTTEGGRRSDDEVEIVLKILDAQPGFIIKILKHSLIDKFI